MPCGWWGGGGGGGGTTVTDAVAFDVTAGETIESGSFVYVSDDDEAMKADNTNAAKSRVVGAASEAGTTGSPMEIKTEGKATVRMVGGLTLVAGDLIFLSTSGRGTDTPSTTAGHRSVILGTVLDASVYAPLAADPTCTAILDIREPIILG